MGYIQDYAVIRKRRGLSLFVLNECSLKNTTGLVYGFIIFRINRVIEKFVSKKCNGKVSFAVIPGQKN